MKSVGGALGSVAAFVFGFVFVGVMVTILITIAIWPGEANLVAPLFCPDGLGDSVVVRDEFRRAPGETVINYSLHCVGERGEVEEVGFLRPFAALAVIHGVLIFSVFGLLGLGRKGRRRDAGSVPPRVEQTVADDGFVDASTAGPFVD